MLTRFALPHSPSFTHSGSGNIQNLNAGIGGGDDGRTAETTKGHSLCGDMKSRAAFIAGGTYAGKRRGEERREVPAQPTGVVCGVQRATVWVCVGAVYDVLCAVCCILMHVTSYAYPYAYAYAYSYSYPYSYSYSYLYIRYGPTDATIQGPFRAGQTVDFKVTVSAYHEGYVN